MPPKGTPTPIPTELEGVAKKEDLTQIHAKLDRCFTQDKYEDFQDAVEKIVGRYLKGKVGWAIAAWIVSILGSMLAQKYLNVL